MDTPGFLPHHRLQQLLDVLVDAGYRVVGPSVRHGAILYEPLSSAAELPAGVVQSQEPGQYRLGETSSPRRFAWANGPQALKPLNFAPRETLWRAERQADGSLAFRGQMPAATPLAVLGVRACDLAALALQDQHFLDEYPDPHYRARRQNLLLIAVACSHSAATCFCASTGDGPQVRAGHDLLLHETDHGYFVEAGSAAGQALLAGLALEAGEPAAFAAAQAEVAATGAAQPRRLPAVDLQQTLFARLDHPRWAAVAERCLSCGNCTQVCPTCFCHAENEVPALDGQSSEHVRQWDSCFTAGHSYLHGVVLRAATEQRYRQWLTHKFGSWHTQYGRSGCVGCGRCITWCPVGIDPSEELAALCAPQEGGDDA